MKDVGRFRDLTKCHILGRGVRDTLERGRVEEFRGVSKVRFFGFTRER